MGDRDHYEGFENEEEFHTILGLALRDCPVLKARTVENIIAHVAPKFMDGLFAVRPCKRRLRYIGAAVKNKYAPMARTFLSTAKFMNPSTLPAQLTLSRAMKTATAESAPTILNG